MAQPFLLPGQKIFLQVDRTGLPTGAAPFIGNIPPRGQGYWVDITSCVSTCCTTTSSTTTTTTTTE